MKNSIKHFKITGKTFNFNVKRQFTAGNQNTSISMRFHNLYLKELERIEKTSYIFLN